jgi:hypothetical protein
MISSSTRGKMATFPPVINGAWNNGNTNGGPFTPYPAPELYGGAPSTNLCVLDGLWGSFNTAGWGDLYIYGKWFSDDSESGWFVSNQTPMGLTACADVGFSKLASPPLSAFSRGKTTWHFMSNDAPWVGGSVDVSVLSGAGNNANNQFCYLTGIEAKDVTGKAAVNLVVADGTGNFTDKDGRIIPAGRWVVHGGGGAFWARVGCQSVPY